MSEVWSEILTTAGPMALIACGSIWVIYKLTARWADQVDSLYSEVLKSLGEVTEALRHINGKDK